MELCYLFIVKNYFKKENDMNDLTNLNHASPLGASQIQQTQSPKKRQVEASPAGSPTKKARLLEINSNENNLIIKSPKRPRNIVARQSPAKKLHLVPETKDVQVYRFALQTFNKPGEKPQQTFLPLDILENLSKTDAVVMLKMASTCKYLNKVMHSPSLHAELTNINKIQVKSVNDLNRLVDQCGDKINFLDLSILFQYESKRISSNRFSTFKMGSSRSIIKINDQLIAQILKKTPNIKTLISKSQQKVTGEFLSSVKDDIKLIEVIDLTFCDSIEREHLKFENISNFLNLRTISYCDNDDHFVKCVHVKERKIERLRSTAIRRLEF